MASSSASPASSSTSPLFATPRGIATSGRAPAPIGWRLVVLTRAWTAAFALPAAAFVLPAAPAVALAQTAPAAQADASQADGAPGAPAEAAPLPVLWETGIGRGATAPPLAAGDRLYVATARQDVKALDVRARRELWSRRLARGFQAAPRLAGSVLVVAAPHPDATAFGLDPDTGETAWERKVGDIAQPPLVGGGRAIFVSMGGWVRALDPRSGDQLWETRVEGVFPGGAALGEAELVVLSAGGVLYRIEAATGRRNGSHDLGGPAASGLVPAPGGGFLAARHDGRVRSFGFDLSPGTTDFAAAPMLHPPAAAGDRLVVAGTDRAVRAYDLPSGELAWEAPLTIPSSAAPAISPDGRRVAVGDLAGRVWTLDLADGRVLSRTPTPGGSAVPAWTPAGLAVVNEDGDLLVLGSDAAPTPETAAEAASGGPQ